MTIVSPAPIRILALSALLLASSPALAWDSYQRQMLELQQRQLQELQQQRGDAQLQRFYDNQDRLRHEQRAWNECAARRHDCGNPPGW